MWAHITTMKANFDSILKSIKDILNMWKWRGLTLLGKIQIVKSFIIPKVLSKAALITVTGDLIKEINSLIYRLFGMETIKSNVPLLLTISRMVDLRC